MKSSEDKDKKVRTSVTFKEDVEVQVSKSNKPKVDDDNSEDDGGFIKKSISTIDKNTALNFKDDDDDDDEYEDCEETIMIGQNSNNLVEKKTVTRRKKKEILCNTQRCTTNLLSESFKKQHDSLDHSKVKKFSSKKDVNFFGKSLKETLAIFRKFICDINNIESFYDDKVSYGKHLSMKPIEKTEFTKKKSISSIKLKAFVLEKKWISNLTTDKLKQLASKQDFELEQRVFFDLEPNLETREFMEDFINVEYGEKEHSQVFVLCDGHTGVNVSKNVCDKLPELFFNILEEESKTESDNSKIVKNALNKSFVEIDLVLHKLFENDPSGTTTNLIYLCLENGKRVVYSGNVGDSRSILIRKDSVLRLSYDHKASDKEEQKRVKKEGGKIIRNRLYGSLAVTRSHGDFEMKSSAVCLSNIPYITRTEIENTDKFIVIASDGVWDMIKDDEVYDIVNSSEFTSLDVISGKQKDLAKFLVRKAFDLGTKDNISCIAIKLN